LTSNTNTHQNQTKNRKTAGGLGKLNDTQKMAAEKISLALVVISSIYQPILCQQAALDAPNATLSISATPIGNASPTLTALRVEGTTAADDEREFLVEFGLNSDHGSYAASTPQKDKVTLYTSIVGQVCFCAFGCLFLFSFFLNVLFSLLILIVFHSQEGTGDIWSINPLIRMDPDSGDYNAQGIELDVDNMNAHRGDDSGASGLAQPNTYGFAVGVHLLCTTVFQKKNLYCANSFFN
jgi:hypothetical protein